jgi:hypothetical protein
MRKANPLAAVPNYDLIFSNFNHCLLRSINSVRRCVRAEQGSPGSPKFAMDRSDHIGKTKKIPKSKTIRFAESAKVCISAESLGKAGELLSAGIELRNCLHR